MREITQAAVVWLAILLGALVFAGPVIAQESETGERASPEAQSLPSVEEINRHLDEMYRSTSSRAVVEMTVQTERRGTRELRMETWTKGEDLSLIVIRSPARESGTATLRTEDGLWNYAPRADRLVRIPTGMLSDNWMGSHLTNDDLVQETGFEEDYNVELSWGEDGGERVLISTMTPKEGAPVVYTRVVYKLDAANWTPREATFYDRDRLVRTMEFSDVREVDGRQVPHIFTVRPEDKPGEFTRMRYRTLEFDVDVDESIFTRRGLRRIAR